MYCNVELSKDDVINLIYALTYEVCVNELDCLRVFRTVGVKNFSFLADNSDAPIEEIIIFLLSEFHSSATKPTRIQLPSHTKLPSNIQLPSLAKLPTPTKQPFYITFAQIYKTLTTINKYKTKTNYLELGDSYIS
jgi:hypothetical protein